MLVNIALWASPELFGDFGSEGRAYWNPLINGLFSIGGQPLEGLPAWPLFETLVGLLLVVGAIYYVLAVRGRARRDRGRRGHRRGHHRLVTDAADPARSSCTTTSSGPCRRSPSSPVAS